MDKWPKLNPLDKRLNLYSNELADKRLEGQVEAEKFIIGASGRIVSFFADIMSEPDEKAGLQTQILFGENVNIFESTNGWSWIQCVRDGFVGWTKSANVSVGFKGASHWVKVPRTFLYSQPDMKKPRIGYRSLASRLTVVGEEEVRGTKYNILEGGEAVIADHLWPVTQFAKDYVSIAETLIHTPYLWGGASAFGIDCSGLVQIALRMSGVDVLRDSDMQAATIGEPIDATKDWSNMLRGDLIFWKGHVGICQGKNKEGRQFLLHANGYSMSVISEPLDQAITRIASLYAQPIGVRRPPKLDL
ncbi:MAG: NlpC/P60 family protein [Nitratireductor sp.]